MTNRVYYIYPGYDHVFQSLMEDLKKENNCVVVNDFFKSKLIKKYWIFLLKHPTLNSKIHELSSKITIYSSRIPQKRINNIVYIFSNISIQFIPDSFLQKIRLRGGKVLLYFIDDLSNQNSKIAFEKTQSFKFDGVYTFDKKNAEEYGYTHLYTMYSKKNISNKTNKYSAIFVGSDKGRFHLIEGIYDKLEECKILSKKEVYFSVYNTEEINAKKYKDKMLFNHSLDYSCVIKLVNESNCIVDIVLGDQQGLSLRAYEAIIYNKKLLTNNSAIFNFPFYNEKYMRYFKTIEDIDPEFVFSEIKVDYQYNGEYSPKKFIEKISSEFPENNLI